MPYTFSSPRPFRPFLEGLEDRVVPRIAFNAALLAEVQVPLQQAVQRMTQLQTQVNTDVQTMKTDAGTFTFFTESMATQTKIDSDYARLGSEVAQVAALDTQAHAEGNLATQVISASNSLGKKRARMLLLQARQQVSQLENNADLIKTAVYAGPPVNQSPVAGQPLAPQYPAFNTITGFPS